MIFLICFLAIRSTKALSVISKSDKYVLCLETLLPSVFCLVSVSPSLLPPGLNVTKSAAVPPNLRDTGLSPDAKFCSFGELGETIKWGYITY